MGAAISFCDVHERRARSARVRKQKSISTRHTREMANEEPTRTGDSTSLSADGDDEGNAGAAAPWNRRSPRIAGQRAGAGAGGTTVDGGRRHETNTTAARASGSRRRLLWGLTRACRTPLRTRAREPKQPMSTPVERLGLYSWSHQL